MAIHKILDKQIRKHLPEGSVNDPGLYDFIKAINDSYEANDRDRELLSHAFEMSELEYIEVNENLVKEHELKKASIEKLKHAIKRNDFSVDLNFEKENDDLLVIADYLNTQISVRKGVERELNRTVNSLVTLLTNLHSGIMVEDENRKMLFTNQLFCDMFEIPLDPESMKGIDCTDAIEQSKHLFKDPEAVVKRVGELLDRKKLFLAEEIELANGEYLERDYIPIFIHNNYKGHLWKYDNITKRKEDENKLRHLNTMQEAILNGTNYSIIYTDVQGTIRSFNKGAERMLGYKASEMIDVQNPGIFHVEKEIADRAARLSEELSTFVAPGFGVFVTNPTRGIVETLEWTYIRKNGQMFPVSLTVCSIKDESDKIIGFLGIARDISEQKYAEEALKKSEEKYRNIIEKSTDIIYKTNSNGYFTYVNPVGERITGFSQRELLTKHFSELIRQDHKKKALIFYRDQVSEKKSTTYLEFPILTKDGKERWIGQSVQYSQLEEGNFELTSLAIDITERKFHERTIALQEEKYRNIIANMNLGLVEVDQNEIIQYCNQGFYELSGFSRDELVGKNIANILANKDNEEIIKEKKQQRVDGISDIYEIPVKNKQGELKWWMVSGAPNYDDTGKLIGSIGIHLDVTQRKLLEQELEISKHKAEESSKAKEAFLANMSHEIRTPLNAIIGMIRELSYEDLSETQRQYVRHTSTASQHLYSVLNNILDISKIEAGEFQLDIQNFEMTALLNEVISIMGARASEKNLFIKLDVSKGVKQAHLGDPVRLKQILLNLIGNSIKFTEKGGITIDCRLDSENAREQCLILSITDTGIGMDSSYLKNIFSKFSQEDISTSRKYGGTGLGMTITHELIHLMNGSIDVESQKNKGTTVHVKMTLPVGENRAQEKKEIVLQNTNDLNKVRVLLVEDNEFNRMVAIKTLSRFKCIVTEAINGSEAVEKLRNETFDIILMDLHMPILDGIGATKIIRNQLQIKTPIIALSANAFKNEIDQCLKIGMNDYVTKPFEEKLLFSAILKNIDKSKTDRDRVTMESKHDPKLYNLDKLVELSQGDMDYVKKMIEIFISQSEASMIQINSAISKRDLDTVFQISHKIKPSIDGLGIECLAKEIREIENDSKKGLYSARLEELITYADKILKTVIADLKKNNQ